MEAAVPLVRMRFVSLVHLQLCFARLPSSWRYRNTIQNDFVVVILAVRIALLVPDVCDSDPSSQQS